MDQILTKNQSMKEFVGKAGVIRRIQKIPGDASARRYYRIHTRTDTFILMVMSPFKHQGPKLDFLEVQKHLAESEVDCPRVLDFDARKGFILLEDMGDSTLLHRLELVRDMKFEGELYKKVIDSLVVMHHRASPRNGGKRIAAFSLDFNFKKLMWEVNFTVEHFYEKHLGRDLRTTDRRVIQEGFSRLCRKLAKEPKVFTHRDFHSRNLMIKPNDETGEDRIVMIDFQDARMGPKQYDLASLLRDSYYQLEEAQVRRLVNYYIKRWQSETGEKLKRDNFNKIFDLMGVQRNFKAIGSFASFLNRRDHSIKMTIAVYNIPPNEKYNEIRVDLNSRKVVSVGRPMDRGFFFGGRYIFEQELFAGLPMGKPSEFVSQILQPAIERGEVAAFIEDGPWLDTGSPQLLMDTHFKLMDRLESGYSAHQSRIDTVCDRLGDRVWSRKGCESRRIPHTPSFWGANGSVPDHFGPQAVAYGEVNRESCQKGLAWNDFWLPFEG